MCTIMTIQYYMLPITFAAVRMYDLGFGKVYTLVG